MCKTVNTINVQLTDKSLHAINSTMLSHSETF